MLRKTGTAQAAQTVDSLAEPDGQFHWTEAFREELRTQLASVHENSLTEAITPWSWVPFPPGLIDNYYWRSNPSEAMTQLLQSSGILDAQTIQELPRDPSLWENMLFEMYRTNWTYNDPRKPVAQWIVGTLLEHLGLEAGCLVVQAFVERIQTDAKNVNQRSWRDVLPMLFHACEQADPATRLRVEPFVTWLRRQPIPGFTGLLHADRPGDFVLSAMGWGIDERSTGVQLLAIERFGAQGCQLLEALINHSINAFSGFGIGQEAVKKSEQASLRKTLAVWMAFDAAAVLDVLIRYPGDPFLLKFTEQLILRWPVWAVQRIAASPVGSRSALVSMVTRLVQQNPTWVPHLRPPEGSDQPRWLSEALAAAQQAPQASTASVGSEQTTAPAASDVAAAPEDLPPLLRQPPWQREKKPTAKEKAEQPWLKLPSRLPTLPVFLAPGRLTPPRLRTSDQPLGLAELEALLTMFALSKPGAPYAGLAQVLPAFKPASLAHLGLQLQGQWEQADCPLEERWMLLTHAWTADSTRLELLVSDIARWPSLMAFPRAKFGLAVLADMATFQRRDEPLRALIRFAEKGKTSLRKPAQEQIRKAAEAMGLTPEQLADRLVPDLGLLRPEDLVFDFGARRFRLHFDESAQPCLTDENGLRLKDLPKPNAKDSARQAEHETQRWKALKKATRALASEQIARLEQALVSQRQWSATEFSRLFRHHPMLRELARRMLWRTQETRPRSFRLSEDFVPVDLNDAPVVLEDTALIRLAHPMELDATERDAWAQIWMDYELLQPFEQFSRRVYRLDPDTPQARADVPSVRDQPVAAGSLLGLIQQGWTKLQDGADIYGLQREFSGDGAATLMLHDSLNAAIPLAVPVLRIRSLALAPTLGPLACSEVLRTVDRLARA